MQPSRSLIVQAVGVVAVFLGTYFLCAASFGAFSQAPVMHTSFMYERGSLLGLAAEFLLFAQFLWPFAIGAFVLERFVLKRGGIWWTLALGLFPALTVAAFGQTSFQHDALFVEYLGFALFLLSPTLWSMLGFSLGYVLNRKKYA